MSCVTQVVKENYQKHHCSITSLDKNDHNTILLLELTIGSYVLLNIGKFKHKKVLLPETKNQTSRTARSITCPGGGGGYPSPGQGDIPVLAGGGGIPQSWPGGYLSPGCGGGGTSVLVRVAPPKGHGTRDWHPPPPNGTWDQRVGYPTS